MLKRSIIVAGAIAALSLAAEYGLDWPEPGARLFVDGVLIAGFAGWVVWGALLERRPLVLWPALLVIAVLVLRPLVEARYGEADPPTAARLLDAFRVSIVARVYLVVAGGIRAWRAYGPGLFRLLVTCPVRATVATYALLIAAGTGMLWLPGAFKPGMGVGVVDTFFLAVSASTLTGLEPASVADAMTRFGQLLLILIVQAGAIAIMVLGAAFWLSVRRRVKNSTPQEAAASLGSVVRVILVSVIGLETLGALLLFWRLPIGEFSTYTRMFIAGFHSVSAFCNAGFSVYGRGMAPFYADGDIITILAGLMIAGGLGFFVYLAAVGRFRRDVPGFRVLAAMIVAVSLGLVLLGTIAMAYYAHGEWASGLRTVFHSVSARSTGFAMAPVGDVGIAGGAVLVMLMLIGGAPGSAAGGIKVTTAIVLGAAILTPRHRRWEPELQAAIAVLAASVFAVGLGIVLLWLAESAPIRGLFFESVSAFTTVGFSQTRIASYSVAGKLVLITMMMLGRVMPMVVGLIVYRRASRPPDGTLMIG